MEWHLITDAPLSLDWSSQHMVDLEVAGKKITLAKWQEGY